MRAQRKLEEEADIANAEFTAEQCYSLTTATPQTQGPVRAHTVSVDFPSSAFLVAQSREYRGTDVAFARATLWWPVLQQNQQFEDIIGDLAFAYGGVEYMHTDVDFTFTQAANAA